MKFVMLSYRVLSWCSLRWPCNYLELFEIPAGIWYTSIWYTCKPSNERRQPYSHINEPLTSSAAHQFATLWFSKLCNTRQLYSPIWKDPLFTVNSSFSPEPDSIYVVDGQTARFTTKFIFTSEPSILDECSLDEKTKEVLIANINRRMMPQAVKVRSDIEVSCYSYEGIDAVKEALRQGLTLSTEDLPIKVKI